MGGHGRESPVVILSLEGREGHFIKFTLTNLAYGERVIARAEQIPHLETAVLQTRQHFAFIPLQPPTTNDVNKMMLLVWIAIGQRFVKVRNRTEILVNS